MEKEKVLKSLNDNQLAADIYLKKYSYNGAENPEDTWHRLAAEFSRAESEFRIIKEEDENQLSKYGKERFSWNDTDKETVFFNYLNRLEILPGGSVIESLGTDKIQSLSNCFFNGFMEDSTDSIADSLATIMNIAKLRGGTSVDVSHLRPKGAVINNASKESKGVIDWMDLVNVTSSKIGQNGRQSGTMVTISDRHPDILDFIEWKKDHSKGTNTNISIKFSDDFFRALKDDGDWILSYPVDYRPINYNLEYNELYIDGYTYHKKVKAKEIWDAFLSANHNCGDPACLFWDKIIRRDGASQYRNLKPEGVNLCAELPLHSNQSCILINVNLSKFIQNPFTDTACVDENGLYQAFYEATCLGDDIVTLESEMIDKILYKIEPNFEISNWSEETKINYQQWCLQNGIKIEQAFLVWADIKETLLAGRKISVGATGWGDTFAMMGKSYGDEDLTMLISRSKLKAELDATIDMAIIRGAFPEYVCVLEYTSSKNSASNLVGMNDWYAFLLESYHTEVVRMCKFGRRNVTWSSYPPTGTLSLLCGTTSGVEPLFAPYYTRRTKVFGDEPFDFEDVDGQKFKNNVVVHPGLIQWYYIDSGNIGDCSHFTEQNWKEIYEKSPYYKQCANELPLETRTKFQGLLNKYTCSCISSTVNLPSTATKEDVEKVYLSAYENGCKSITVYRDGSKGGVLVTTPTQTVTSRPKVLNCKVLHFKNDKKDWVAFLGLLNNKPYEIFTGPRDIDIFPVPITVGFGKIIKVKPNKDERSRYDFSYIDSYGYENRLGGLSRIFSREFYNYGRFVSSLLRGAYDIPEIIRILNGLEFETKSLNSWKFGVIRAIKEYIPDGTDAKEVCPECGDKLVYENGCYVCKSCGYSKCL